MKKRWKLLLLGFAAVMVVGGLAWWRLSASASSDQMSGEAVVPTSVRVARVARGTVQSWVFAEGTARSVRREYLSFENPGRVVLVKDGLDGEDLREGDEVHAGEVLVRQDQRAILADITSAEATVAEARTQVTVAEAELTRARTEEDLASKTLERFAVLLEQESASKQEHDEAVASAALATAAVSQAESRLAASHSKVTSAEARLNQAELTLEDTELRAPMNGIVAYVNVKEGYYFTPSQVRTDSETAALQSVPMVVIDPSAFEVTVNIPSFSRGRVRAGQEAVVAVRPEAISKLGSSEPPVDGEDFVRGTVFSVNPAVSPGGRAVQVKVRVTEGAHLLEDGLFVSVWLAADSQEDVPLCPVSAFVFENNKPHVFVVDKGVARRRSVELGLQEFSVQEVNSGLEAGELVVTDGRFRMSDGAHVRVLADDVEVGQ